MDKIYNLDNGSKLALYSIEKQLFVHTIPLLYKAKPMIIANDFSQMLHSCIFNNTIYFVYKNTSHNLILVSLPSGNPQIILNDEALLFDPHIENLHSTENSNLLMTVILKNPLNNTYSVNVIFLVPHNKKITIIENLQTFPILNTILIQNTLTIFVSSDSDRRRIFTLSIHTNNDSMQYETTEIPTVITITQPCENCKNLQNQVTTLTTRYNELVETAKKIQEEGRYWKHLYESS